MADVKQKEHTTNDIEELKTQKYELEPARVEQASKELVLFENDTVTMYAQEVQNKISAIADGVLADSKEQNHVNVQKTLDKLLKKFDEADPDELMPEDKGMLGRFLDKMTKSIEKKMEQMNSSRAQIDKLAVNLEVNRDDLLQAAETMEAQYNDSKQTIEELDYYIEGAKRKAEELAQHTLPMYKKEAEEGSNPNAMQEITDTEDFIERVNRKVYDLQGTRAVMMQSMSEMRFMAGMNRTLAEQVNSSILTSIPIWKISLSNAINMMNQRSALAAQEKLNKGTNMMIEKNAENMAKNIRKTAETQTRSVVDVETMRKSRDNVKKAIEDASKIIENGKQKRAQHQEELEQLRKEDAEFWRTNQDVLDFKGDK